MTVPTAERVVDEVYCAYYNAMNSTVACRFLIVAGYDASAQGHAHNLRLTFEQKDPRMNLAELSKDGLLKLWKANYAAGKNPDSRFTVYFLATDTMSKFHAKNLGLTGVCDVMAEVATRPAEKQLLDKIFHNA